MRSSCRPSHIAWDPAVLRESHVRRDDITRAPQNHVSEFFSDIPLTSETAESIGTLPHQQPHKQLRVAIFGGCLTQFVVDELRKLAWARGLDVQSKASWPHAELGWVEQFLPDILFCQFSTTWLLGPLWDELPFLTPEQIAERLAHAKAAIDLQINRLQPFRASRLFLAVGFSTPPFSPWGQDDFRQAFPMQRVVYELNAHLISRIKHDPNALYIDEEALSSRVGKQRLWDDVVTPFSHHAPLDFYSGKSYPGPTREELFRAEQPHQVLSCTLHSGHRPRLWLHSHAHSRHTSFILYVAHVMSC
jgi:hypothetical protein